MKILLLTGSEGKPYGEMQSGSGVGKDHVAEILVKAHGFYHYKFADGLRDKVYSDYKLDKSKKGDKEYEFSHQVGNQTVQQLILKTANYLSDRDPYIFVRQLLDKLHTRALINPVSQVVISDCRRIEELMVLKLLNALLVLVEGDSVRSPQPLDCKLINLADYNLSNYYLSGQSQDCENDVELLVKYLKTIPHINFINRWTNIKDFKSEIFRG